jgi:type I restriction enzyme S subunit
MPTISENDFMQLAVPVTNSKTRAKTSQEISGILSEGHRLAKRLEEISSQIQKLLSAAKSNIFDLLDDKKFSAMSAKAKELEGAMTKIKEPLQ